MKKLKTFEQMYSDPNIEAELGNIGREGDITPEEFQALIDNAFESNDIDIITKMLVNLRFKYEPKDNPLLKTIYYDAIRKWNKSFDTLGKPSDKLIAAHTQNFRK
jgi:hypothetical protein